MILKASAQVIFRFVSSFVAGGGHILVERGPEIKGKISNAQVSKKSSFNRAIHESYNLSRMTAVKWEISEAPFRLDSVLCDIHFLFLFPFMVPHEDSIRAWFYFLFPSSGCVLEESGKEKNT